MDVPSTSSSEYAPSHIAFVDTVNDFFLKYGLNPVDDLKDITASVLVSVYELILGDRLHGAIRDQVTREDEIHNIQCIIDSLAKDFLHCDLSHITGVAIFEGDITTIQYLMEIFIELESFLMEQISDDPSSQSEGHPQDRDSLTRGTVAAISDVLREEGIRSPPTRDKDTDNSVRSSDSQLPSSISGDLEQHHLESDLSMEEMIRLGDKAAYGRYEPSLKRDDFLGEISNQNQALRKDPDGKQSNLGIPLSDDNRITSTPPSLNSSTSTFSSAPWPEPPPPSSGPLDVGSEFETLGMRPRPDSLPLGKYSHLMEEDNRPYSVQQHTHTHHHYHQTVSFASGSQRTKPSLAETLPVKMTSANKAPPLGVSSQLPSDSTSHMASTLKSNIPSMSRYIPSAAVQPPTSKSWQATTDSSRVPPYTSQVPPSKLQVPPSTSQVPPSTSQMPPSTSQMPLPTSHIPPAFQSSQVPPSTSLPTSTSRVPPSSSQVPPSTSRMPPSTTHMPPTSTLSSTYKPSTSIIPPASTACRKPSVSQVPISSTSHLPLSSKSQMPLLSKYKPSTSKMPPVSTSWLPSRAPPKKAATSRPQVSKESKSSSGLSQTKQGPVVRDYPSREAFITLTPPKRKISSRQTRYQRHASSKLKERDKISEDSYVRKEAASKFKPTDPKGDRHVKSQSWDEEDVIHYQKVTDERSLHKNSYPKSRSFEESDVHVGSIPGPSNDRAKRKVAFHVEESDDSDTGGLTRADLLEKLRRGQYSVGYSDSDSDISVHSDSIIDYDKLTSDNEDEPVVRSRLRTKGRRSPRSPVSGSVLLERSPPRQKMTTVRFEDVLDAKAKGTMGKIRRKVSKEKKLQDIERKTLQFLYSAGLRELQRDLEEQGAKRKRLINEQDREYKRKVLRKPKTSGNKPAKKYTARLVPPASPDRSRQPGQKWKRVGSPSQALRRQKRLTIGDDEVLPVLLSEFPFLHVSPETVHAMWSKQMKQMEQLTKDGMHRAGKNKLQKKIEDAERRHQLLMDIMKKELAHNQRMRELKEKQEKKRVLQRKEREKRQVTARARRYYDEFRLQAQSRMVKRKTKEERIFKNLFDEALKIQKSRIMELRKYAKEKREEMAGRQEDEIESMENYYRDQFNLLAEALEKERHQLQVRDQAQARVLEQMRRTMRLKMETEIRDFQNQLYQDEDTVYFRQLDAERMKEKIRNAAYKTQI